MKRLLAALCAFLPTILPASQLCFAQTPQISHPWRLDTAQSWITTLSVKGADQYSLPSLSSEQQRLFQTAFADWAAGKPTEAKPTIGDVNFDDLSSELSERIKRAPSVKIEGVQASKYVYGVPYGSPAGTQAGFLGNPDSALFNYSATLNFSELFLSVSDRTTACKSASALRAAGMTVNIKPGEKDFCKDYEFITGDRNRDFAQRLVSGITVTYTASQNAKFQKSLLQGERDITFSHSVTGSFDPTKMWRSASDWESAAAVYASQAVIRGAGDDFSASIEQFPRGDAPVGINDFPCLDLRSSVGCFYRYAYGWHKVQILEALIPRVDVKVVTPLNFQAANNVFLVQPADERKVLYTVALSVDLTKFIPNNKTRASAANVLVTLANTEAKRKSADVAHAWRLKVAASYAELVNNPSLVDDETWWNQFRSLIQNPMV